MKYAERFRKGSLVPRRLGVITTEPKNAQHWIVFGVDAVWDGIRLVPEGPLGEDDALIKVDCKISAPRKNGTRRKCSFTLDHRFIAHSAQAADGSRSAGITRKDVFYSEEKQ